MILPSTLPDIAILMSTFNGGPYLANQLLSLQQQTYHNWKLYIRDDGSTDNTIDIIEKFQKIDSRIFRVDDNLGNLKPGKSFLAILKYCDAPYYVYCDQDDIWFERKLEILVNCAQTKFISGAPCIAYCDGYAYDTYTGSIVSDSISRLHAKKLKDFLFFNSGYQGCSILFNQKMANELRSYTAAFYLHDDITSLIAHCFGYTYFIPKRLMLYRQHDNNVTGNVVGNWREIIRNFVMPKNNYVISKIHFEEKKAFYEFYKNKLDPSARKLFEAYLAFPALPKHLRLFTIILHRFTIGGHMIPLIIKTLIRKPLSI